jgi:hypothetical protein
MVAQDVWCGPGIGLSADAVVGSVDCVVSRRNVSGRGKIDGEKINQRDRERGVHFLLCIAFLIIIFHYFSGFVVLF